MEGKERSRFEEESEMIESGSVKREVPSDRKAK